MIDYQAEWAKLPGEVILSIDDSTALLWTQNYVAVRAVHTIQPGGFQPRVYKIAAYIPISADFMRDVEDWRNFANAALDHRLRPWAYPDRRTLPFFELFPRLTRWQARWQCVKRHIGQYLTGGDECALMEL